MIQIAAWGLTRTERDSVVISMEKDYSIWPDHPGSGFSHDDNFVVTIRDCPRTGGGYAITNAAVGQLKLSLERLSEDECDGLRARLTSMLVERRGQGEENPLVTPGLVKEAMVTRALAVHERADRLLTHIISRSNNIGYPVKIGNEGTRDSYGQWIEFPDSPTEQNAMAWSESTSEQEVQFLTEYLVRQDWIEAQISGRSKTCTVLVDGYEHAATQSAKPRTDQAFIAMWFADEVQEAYETGIRPAVLETGFKPMRIDQKPDVDKIDDEIIAEIRRSRFLVADFTHGDGGARGGVYYEAGFAHGLAIPVIRTCRKDKVCKLHFDTRQYHHVVWDTNEGLHKALMNRILAVIGEGPNVHSIKS